MARVGIVASDLEVVLGLQRVFSRHRGVEIVRVAPESENADACVDPAHSPPRSTPAAADGEAPGTRSAPVGAYDPMATPFPDLLILDIWPPTPNEAEAVCAAAHARHPVLRSSRWCTVRPFLCSRALGVPG